MKNRIYVLLGVLLLVSAIAVYAHGSKRTTNTGSNSYTTMDLDEIDEMHEEMTKSLDPELKEKMDLMHEGCMASFNRREISEEGQADMMQSSSDDTMGSFRGTMMNFAGMMPGMR